MELVLFILFLVVAFFVFKSRKQPQRQVQAPDDPASDDNELVIATRNLSRIIEECTESAPDGFRILAKISSADGKVSRDDLLIMVRYAERLGAKIEAEWMEGLKRLNTGVSIKVTGTDAMYDELENISKHSLLNIAILYGSAIALTIGSKRTTKSAIALMEAVENAITAAAQSATAAAQAGDSQKVSITVDGPRPVEQPLCALQDQMPTQAALNQSPEPDTPFVQDWVTQAKAELSAERKR